MGFSILLRCCPPVNVASLIQPAFLTAIRKMEEQAATNSLLPSIFQGVKDIYNGVVIRSSAEPHERDAMERILQDSLTTWAKNKIRGVWFEVESAQAEWIPVLIKNGFTFHHANKEMCILLKWLPLDDPCPVPYAAHTMVGVGGMVVNNKNEILVIREKYYKQPHWKLPGGYVDPGESLVKAVVREVFEETGVKAEFLSLVSLRHIQPTKEGLYKGLFNCSDFYFAAYLKPLGNTEIKICERELETACWMPLEEYAAHPLVHPNNQLLARQLMATIDGQKPTLPIQCIESTHSLTGANQQVYLVGERKFRIGNEDD